MFNKTTLFLLFVMMYRTPGCLVNETRIGYQNDAVDMVFNVNVTSHNLQTYQIVLNTTPLSSLMTALYQNGNQVGSEIISGGVESIGNIPDGNLSFRIPSMNTSSAGVYILKCLSPLQNIKCIELKFRARPNPPVIPTSDPSGNEVFGKEGKDITLVCRSTGGYPKPTMAWYRTNNQTTPLSTNTEHPQRDDRTYQIEYTFRAIRADDGTTFICESSYDAPDSLYMQAQIKLNLSLKPSIPMMNLNTPLRENSNNMVIANCSSSGFKPNTAQLTLMLEGSTMIPAANSYPSSTGTFVVTAEYTSTITKTINGKLLTCSVNHTALDAPLREQRNLEIQFAPETATLSGVSSGIVADVKKNITLTCTAGSSNPPSNVTWYRNNITIESNSQIQHTSGEYNGHLTSQKLVFEAVRAMDGDEIVCEVNNVVNGDNRERSDTRTLDLRFHPIAELLDVASVVEGREKVFQCDVQSKPASSITWYHNNRKLSIRNQTQYRIHIVNRSHAGLYRCEAVNGYLPNGTSQTNLTVQYTPDVEVTTTNVTVNDSLTQVRCSPSGIPDTYTFSEWQHIWPGVGPVVHKTGLGRRQTLTLSQLTYEYSGIYKCSVNNSINGSLNPNAGYGVAYLQVETYPIITAEGDFKVPGRLNRNTTATIAFYSNVKDNNVECFIGNTTHACSVVFEVKEVNLPLFDTTIKTSGTFAHISFSISSMDQFSDFNIKISNSIGYSERAVEVIPEGSPQIPEKISIVETQSNSVTLSWVPGFHGGFNQTFVIKYSTDGQSWLPENRVEIQGGLTLRRINGTVSNLQSGTMYFMRLMSRNEKGNSNYTRVFNVTTVLSQVPDVVTKNKLLPAVVGGLAAVIAIAVVVIVVLSIRLHSRKHAGDQPDSGNDVHYNTDRPVYDDLRYDGNPHAYSVLGDVGNYEDLTHDTTGVQPYSNLNKEGGSHAASLVNKTYENLQLSPLK